VYNEERAVVDRNMLLNSELIVGFHCEGLKV